MKYSVSQENIENVQQELDEFQKDINKILVLQEMLKNVIKKPIEKITAEEVSLFEELKKSLPEVQVENHELSCRLTRFGFYKVMNEWKEMHEKFPLVDESEFATPLEKEKFNEVQEIITKHSEQTQTIDLIEKTYKDIKQKFEAKSEREWIDKKSEEIKEAFLEPQADSSCVIMVYGEKSEVISTKEASLIRDGILPPPGHVTYHDCGYAGEQTLTIYHPYEIEDLNFIPYSEATLEQKQQIRVKEKKLKDIIKSKNPEYSKRGTAFVRTSREKHEIKRYEDKKIPVETTSREMAEAGLLYSEYEFKPSREISTREIAEACNCYALTTEESRGIKGFLNKLKEIFRGKGEK